MTLQTGVGKNLCVFRAWILMGKTKKKYFVFFSGWETKDLNKISDQLIQDVHDIFDKVNDPK